MRLALVHDWLNQMGGAENVLEALVEIFPGAPVYTSLYDPAKMPDAYRAWDIRTSFMQRLPGVSDHHQAYLPLYPVAFRSLDVSGYDLVLTNKSGFCHGIKTKNGDKRAVQICYCLTPTRYVWRYEQYREREQIRGLINAGLQPVLALLRRWDYAAAQRVDHFIAISSAIQSRIRETYGRESVVIHPPVDTSVFTPDPTGAKGNGGDYFLIVSRLIPYKRIDLAVQAFNRLPDRRLIIVGDGRDRAELEAAAGPNITFLGRQPREKLVELMRGCRAFIFPGEEDFGIAPVEALSAGRPVIAFGAGGALDTVLPGVTGEHFPEPSVDSLHRALAHFDPTAYDPAACRSHAERFSAENFRNKLIDFVGQIAGELH